MLVTNPSSVPSSVRVDQLDRSTEDIPACTDETGTNFPAIVHFGIRPPQLSYAGNPEYQKGEIYCFMRLKIILKNLTVFKNLNL